MQSWHRGEYECKATVSGFPSSRLINFLHIKGPPSVSVREEIIAANGETIEIICEVKFYFNKIVSKLLQTFYYQKKVVDDLKNFKYSLSFRFPNFLINK